MRPALSGRDLLLWAVLGLLALAVCPLLVRNALMIGQPVPLDPNEGWNAAHTINLMTGHGLYPQRDALLVNNYPPLSFYAVGMLTRLTGDAIFAGRLLSLLSFLAVAAGLGVLLRQMKCGPGAMLLGILFFAAALLVASDYVGMDDPQLLGHAVQMAALLLVLRRRIVVAALLFAASLFIKHNLIALPLATALWLTMQERRAGLAFIAWGIGFALLGLALFHLAFGTGLLAELASARRYAATNMREALLQFLPWAALPLAAMAALPRDRWGLLCGLWLGIGLVIGLVFSAGDGVDANIFFDTVLALSLGLGIAIDRPRWGWVLPLAALPLLASLALHFDDNNFFFTRDFAVQSRGDIAFLKAHPGPALCDQLSLCLWAGKPAEVDVFNIGEQIATGARDPAPLAKLIENRHFAVLQFESLDDFALGARVRAAVMAAYRIDHTDDNGVFLVPKP